MIDGNRQPHPYSAGFRGVESLEDVREMCRIDARPGIAHGHKNPLLVLLRADQQLSWPLNRSHCFDRIQHQVQDDLLQWNTIPLNGKRPFRKMGIYRAAILGDFASRPSNHLIDGLIEIKTILCGGFFSMWSRIRSMIAPLDRHRRRYSRGLL